MVLEAGGVTGGDKGSRSEVIQFLMDILKDEVAWEDGGHRASSADGRQGLGRRGS